MRISDWSSAVCSSDLRDAKTYTARGNARAASGEVEVLADVLIAYYREPAEGGEGDSEIYLLEAAGSVRIKSPEGTVYGDKGRYKLDEQVFVMTGEDLRMVSKDDVVTARDSLEYWEGQRKAVARGARSEEHTSELQSLMRISYAVFCLKKKT